MERAYHRWFSPHMGHDMELLVFGHSGAKVLVFPTRDGRFHEYEDLGLVAALQPRIEAGELQLFCVDSAYHQTFYAIELAPPQRVARHRDYEQYLITEVVPLMRYLNPLGQMVAHGCSLGAFHAATLAFRHPQLFNRLVAFSGRYDLTLEVEHFRNLLDGHYDQDVYFHTPTHFLPNLQCPTLLRHLRQLDVTLVIGSEDPFLANNRALQQILDGKGIRNSLHEWPERAHRGSYWRRMAPLYL